MIKANLPRLILSLWKIGYLKEKYEKNPSKMKSMDFIESLIKISQAISEISMGNPEIEKLLSGKKNKNM